MKNLFLLFPIGCFISFFLFQIFALELIIPTLKPILANYSQHLLFLLRILIVCILWNSLFPNLRKNLSFNLVKVPKLFFIIIILHSALFFPWPLPEIQFSTSRITLHILVSTWEEVLMRGLFLALLLRKYPRKPISVIIIVGCLFGTLHFLNVLNGSPLDEVLPQVIWSCSLGIAFTAITYKSKSLVPAVILHCIFNLIPAIWDGSPWILTSTSPHGINGLMFIGLLFTPLVLIVLWRLDFEYNEIDSWEQDQVRQ